ncbi:SDR family oxidoreductase [Haladaptatus sp. GCM10025707]|uniref:SDR family oxidoreductase n=1 Tax=unclassified Haladaptatus TaxID=2622732 RepID=UPI0023E75CC0|nr:MULTISPECIES: SDR family oxidoreductase [unclassified Haladaptatus]
MVPVDLSGQVIMVTGATSGIGRETARGLAEMGAHVVITGRNRAAGEKVVATIEAETDGSATLLIADFAEPDEVRRLAREFREQYDRLNILVHNAGTFEGTRTLTATGVEKTLAVNHLAPMLLTYELIDMLVAIQGRIVVVSSDAHRGARMHFDDLSLEGSFSGMKAYGQSKLANVLFTYELARQLKGTGVTANALHPGVIPQTGLTRNSSLMARAGFNAMRLVPGLTTSERGGAQTSIYLAASPEVAGVLGNYFDGEKAVRSASNTYDTDAQKRLWTWSVEQLGLRAELPLD